MRTLSGLLSAVLLAVGCISSRGPGVSDWLPRAERPFVRSPAEDYPRSLGPTTERRLTEAFTVMIESGDTVSATRLAAELLGRNPDFHPARVLAAQADFLQARYDDAVTRLIPVVTDHPGYTPAQLLLGRSAEKLGNLIESFEAYRAVSEASQAARSRAAELRPRVIDVATRRVESALARGKIVDAERELDRLEALAPEDEATFEIMAQVAAATGDAEAELAALRRLASRDPEVRDRLERRAELELQIGEPALGMRLLEELASEHPDDLELADKLVEARFAWRMQLLPPEIRRLATEPQLPRGDFATLLFWLFPEVRYGRADGAKIANDVLDHPHRDEIVRVVNLELMDVDPSLHRFDPYRPVRRLEALASLLRLLGRRQPQPSCVGISPPQRLTTASGVCSVAAVCGLISEEADCLPYATLSGQEALRLSRSAQELMGGE